VRRNYRLLFVWSQAKARQEAATRDRHLAKVREAFAAVERNLNRYSLKTHEAIVRRLEAAKAKYAEGELFAYELTQDRREQFHLQWQLDAKALEEWKLLTNGMLGRRPLRGWRERPRIPVGPWLAPILWSRRCESRINRYRCVLGPAEALRSRPE